MDTWLDARYISTKMFVIFEKQPKAVKVFFGGKLAKYFSLQMKVSCAQWQQHSFRDSVFLRFRT